MSYLNSEFILLGITQKHSGSGEHRRGRKKNGGFSTALSAPLAGDSPCRAAPQSVQLAGGKWFWASVSGGGSNNSLVNGVTSSHISA